RAQPNEAATEQNGQKATKATLKQQGPHLFRFDAPARDEILQRRPDLKGKSLEAIKRIFSTRGAAYRYARAFLRLRDGTLRPRDAAIAACFSIAARSLRVKACARAAIGPAVRGLVICIGGVMSILAKRLWRLMCGSCRS